MACHRTLSFPLQVPSGTKFPTKGIEKSTCLELLKRVEAEDSDERLEELNAALGSRDLFHDVEDAHGRRDDVHLLLGTHLSLRH